MSEAFSPTYGSGYTHVVMWVGIQDFLTTVDCGLTRATVASRVTAAVNALRSAAPPGIKIAAHTRHDHEAVHVPTTHVVRVPPAPVALASLNGRTT